MRSILYQFDYFVINRYCALLRSLPSDGTGQTPKLKVTSLWTNHGVCTVNFFLALMSWLRYQEFDDFLIKNSKENQLENFIVPEFFCHT